MESQKSEPVKMMSLPNLSRHAEIVNDLAWNLRNKYQGDECAEKLSDASSGLLRQWRYRQRLVVILLTASSFLTLVFCLVALIWYKWQREAEFLQLTSITSLSVQGVDARPPEEVVRYAVVVERMAERNPPFGTSNPWRNSYWLIEWVRSANSHFLFAKQKKDEPGMLKWRTEGLSRIERVLKSDETDVILRPDERKRLLNFKAQFSEEFKEIIAAYESAWGLRYKASIETANQVVSFDVTDFVVGNNLAMAIVESHQQQVQEGKKQQNEGIADMTHAWDVTVEVLDFTIPAFQKKSASAQADAVLDTAWLVFQELEKSNDPQPFPHTVSSLPNTQSDWRNSMQSCRKRSQKTLTGSTF